MTEGDTSKPAGSPPAPPGSTPAPPGSTPAPRGARAEARPLPRAWPTIPEAGALVVVLIAMCVLFSFTSPFFLSYDNIVNIATASAVILMVAAPATPVPRGRPGHRGRR